MAVPDRKFLSEFAVNLYSARWIIFPANQLSPNLEIPEGLGKEVSQRCHIYLICRRPASAFDPENFVFDGTFIRGNIVYKIAGVPTKVPFSMPFELPENGVRIELAPYPHREFRTLDAAGNEITYVPASSISLWGLIQEPALRDSEVLYVGQAYADGQRTAIDRLRSHSTLQRILADTHYEMPDDEISVLAFEYVPYRVITSMDGTDKNAISDDSDQARFLSILDNPLTEAQQISLIEAGLIRHFRPRYNIIYKESFPASDQVLLNSCYELDFSALIVEIDTEDLPVRLFSAPISPSGHHTAKFNLIDPETRRSFFTFIDKDGKALEIPGVVSPTR
jgi:hypothetical protein